MNTPIDLVFTMVLLGILLVVPLLGRREQRRLERELAEGSTTARADAFASTVRWQWTLTAVLMAGWWFSTFDADSVFLQPGWSGGQWVAVALGLLLSAFMIGQTLVVRGRASQLTKIREQIGKMAMFVPRTRREQHLFDGLSLTAGVCEEVAYRGLLIGVLASPIGLWPAVGVSIVLFGLAHAYQGAAGAARAGLFGGIAALLTVFSGSIYVAVVAHVITDLSQGRMLATALRDSDRLDPVKRNGALPV